MTTHIPTLPRLLRQLNKALGWRPVDMANFMRKDLAEISRLLNGKIARPHDSTLEYIAEKYREAGLEGVTTQHLIMARDVGGKAKQDKFMLPAQWVRLVQMVLSFDEEFADIMYRKWSQDLELSARLVYRGNRQEGGLDPDIDQERATS